MSGFRLCERDEEIAHGLAICVRLFSLRQIAQHWFFGDLANARRRMRQLQKANIVECVQVRARPLPQLRAPEVAWSPGDATPNFGAASVRFRTRWRTLPVRTYAAFVASGQTKRRYGGRGGSVIKNGVQVTHDLGVAQIWMLLDEQRPHLADAWRGEDVMAQTRRGQKLPDAFIVDSQQRTACVIEFGGAYETQRIRDFHEDCRNRGLPYEIW